MKYCETAETTCWEIGAAESYRQESKIEECGRVLYPCSEIVRDETGAIDSKHYHAKARDLRSEAIVTAPKNMIRFFAEIRQMISKISGFSV